MRPHLTPNRAFAKEMLHMAIDANKPVPETPTSVLCEWEQSVRAEEMARMLAECGAFQLHQTPKPWDKLPPEVQQRFRQLAEQAIRQIDVAAVDKAMETAIAETNDWMSGPSVGPPPTVAEIARECVHRFQALLSTPEVKL